MVVLVGKPTLQLWSDIWSSETMNHNGKKRSPSVRLSRRKGVQIHTHSQTGRVQ